MSKIYDMYSHTHVVVNHPKMTADRRDLIGQVEVEEAWRGPMFFLLHTGEHVWVQADYSALGHPDVKQVGDGRDNGFDANGGCILSVPAAWCTYYTAEEAEGIERCIDADDRLLSYARG